MADRQAVTDGLRLVWASRVRQGDLQVSDIASGQLLVTVTFYEGWTLLSKEQQAQLLGAVSDELLVRHP